MSSHRASTSWRLAAVALAATAVAIAIRLNGDPEPAQSAQGAAADAMLDESQRAERLYSIDVRLADLAASSDEGASVATLVSRALEQRLLLAQRQRIEEGLAAPALESSIEPSGNPAFERVLAWAPILAGTLLAVGGVHRLLAPRRTLSLDDPWQATVALALPTRHADDPSHAAA